MPSKQELDSAAKTLAMLGGFEEENILKNFQDAVTAHTRAKEYVNKEEPLNGPEIRASIDKALAVLTKQYNQNVRLEKEQRKKFPKKKKEVACSESSE